MGAPELHVVPANSSNASRRWHCSSTAYAGDRPTSAAAWLLPLLLLPFFVLPLLLLQLLLQVGNGTLNLQPSYQRSLVWDRKKASRLVITALEGRVIPTLLLAKGTNGMLIIPRQQRRLVQSMQLCVAGDPSPLLHCPALCCPALHCR